LSLTPSQHQSAFTQKLAHVVSAMRGIPDSPPQGFTADAMIRLRELADETIEAIELRIDSEGDGDKVQQRLAERCSRYANGWKPSRSGSATTTSLTPSPDRQAGR
jgi:hypothetical protein